MKPHSMPYRLLLSAVLGFAAAALGGCGNINPDLVARASKDSLTGTTGTLDPFANGGFTDPGYTCPGSPNLKPTYTYHTDGSDTYTACPSQANSTDVSIHGKPSADTPAGVTRRICVFPIQIVDASHFYPKYNQYARPTVSCVAFAEPIRLSYPATNYNALAIVEEADEARMEDCLAKLNTSICPAYSRGQFR
jgi:hypothetical protein